MTDHLLGRFWIMNGDNEWEEKGIGPDRELRESYKRGKPPYSNNDEENLAYMKEAEFSPEKINFWLSWHHEQKKRLFGPQTDQSKWVFTEEEGEEKIRRGEWIVEK
jgi:hypothetical protein